jgi:hypothetical protein
MTEAEQSQEQAEPTLKRGIGHDAVLVGATLLAEHGLGPYIDAGIEKLQDVFQHDPKPEIKKAPGYDHDD